MPETDTSTTPPATPTVEPAPAKTEAGPGLHEQVFGADALNEFFDANVAEGTKGERDAAPDAAPDRGPPAAGDKAPLQKGSQKISVEPTQGSSDVTWMTDPVQVGRRMLRLGVGPGSTDPIEALDSQRESLTQSSEAALAKKDARIAQLEGMVGNRAGATTPEGVQATATAPSPDFSAFLAEAKRIDGADGDGSVSRLMEAFVGATQAQAQAAQVQSQSAEARMQALVDGFETRLGGMAAELGSTGGAARDQRDLGSLSLQVGPENRYGFTLQDAFSEMRALQGDKEDRIRGMGLPAEAEAALVRDLYDDPNERRNYETAALRNLVTKARSEGIVPTPPGKSDEGGEPKARRTRPAIRGRGGKSTSPADVPGVIQRAQGESGEHKSQNEKVKDLFAADKA